MRSCRVGDLIELERRRIDIDPLGQYEEIGVRSFGRGIFHKEPVMGASLGSKRMFAIQPGDLVLNNVFAWEAAVAMAGTAEEGKCGSHRFLTYTARDGHVDLTYLRYFFTSEAGLAALGQASPGSAGRNRTLAIERFENLRIPLPGIVEQQRIASRLEKQLAATQALAARLGGGGSGDQILNLYPSLAERIMRRAEQGSAPIGEVADFVNDLVRPGESPDPAQAFVGLQHVESHTGRRVGQLPLGGEKGRKFRFQPGDVVYGYLRPYLNKVWVADMHGLCSVDQYVLRPRRGITAHYLAHALRSRTILDQTIAMTHSLQLPRLRSGLLAQIRIPMVAGAEIEQVTADLDRILATVIEARDRRSHQVRLVKALACSVLNHAFAELG